MCPEETPGPTGSLSAADATKQTRRVRGMTCASCVGRAEAALLSRVAAGRAADGPRGPRDE